MKTRTLLVAACLLSFASQAQETKKELWKWTDANGVVHYSDVPGPGATKLDLNIVEAPPKAAAAPTPSTQSVPSAQPPRAVAPTTTYQSLEIWEPANEASFFEADVTVSVRLRSEPALAEGDFLVLYLDNEPVQGSPNATDYTLSGLDRGGHTLVAQILDAKGKEKIRSESVVFYIKHVTVIPPKAVGPNVKPPTATRPPRPTPRGG